MKKIGRPRKQQEEEREKVMGVSGRRQLSGKGRLSGNGQHIHEQNQQKDKRAEPGEGQHEQKMSRAAWAKLEAWSQAAATQEDWYGVCSALVQ